MSEATYEDLPNGKRRYLRATVGDIIFSVLLPFRGVVIGGLAAIRKEKIQGKTMMIIGATQLALIVFLRLMGT